MSNIKKYWGAPGTGKTTQLLSDINDLIKQGYNKDDFVITTYGRAMADEIKDRLGWDRSFESVNTIHGICKQLAGIVHVVTDKHKKEFCTLFELNYEGDDDTDENYQQHDKSSLGSLFFNGKSFIINNMIDFNSIMVWSRFYKLSDQVKLWNDHTESGKCFISFRRELKSENHAVEFKNPVIEFMQYISEQYQIWKSYRNLYDFDDMLQIAYDKGLKPGIKILIIDEFQDVTPLQYAIIVLWEQDAEHIIIAGDPRQTIFGFTGADQKYFEHHPGETIILKKSYRLPKNIWNFARKIVTDVNLIAPDIQTTDKPGKLSNITENDYYTKIISNYKENTFHLIRTNAMGKKIGHVLINEGIPFYGLGGWGANQTSLYNAILKVRQGLLGNNPLLSSSEVRNLVMIYKKEMWVSTKKTLQKGMYFNDLRNHGKAQLWDNINNPRSVFNDCIHPFSDVKSVARAKLSNALQKHSQLIENLTVAVLTIHRSKGLETKHVFLHDQIIALIAEKIMEFEKAAQDEAQVFYVGSTRASESLFIVNANEGYTYEFPILLGESI